MRNQDTQQFIEQHINDNTAVLALKYHKADSANIDIIEALQQIAAFQYIRKKIPSWSNIHTLCLPGHLSLEQSSSESTAKNKISIAQRWVSNFDSMIDLTGGMGIDCFFLSKLFNKSCYVEQHEDICTRAAYNYAQLGVDTKIICCDAIQYLQNNPGIKWDLIFIDPARRGAKGERVYGIESCTPNLAEAQETLLSRAGIVMAKLSPMLDIAQALQQLKNVVEINVVSVENECKELIFVMKKDAAGGEPIIVATNIDSNENTNQITNTLTKEYATQTIFAKEIKQFIYEPWSSVMKAGLFKSVASEFGVEKLDVNSHLYTSGSEIDKFCGRRFKVIRTIDFNNREIKALNKTIQKANVAVRNFPLTTDELKKKLRISDGGDIYLFATTINTNQKKIIICKKTD